ncbi:hypothetical protein BDA99DRAFT_537270 [Phascolomyces articulosus]|uniref:Uncharacterized protein n=1 Tax=Phascolomyces articulosus TaxID=60185 RepID=A0AAD5PE90_9FUNG|nr:hypothetical protein BDA99DRAFT_537270 [Phascolomyces articulosus]
MYLSLVSNFNDRIFENLSFSKSPYLSKLHTPMKIRQVDEKSFIENIDCTRLKALFCVSMNNKQISSCIIRSIRYNCLCFLQFLFERPMQRHVVSVCRDFYLEVIENWISTMSNKIVVLEYKVLTCICATECIDGGVQVPAEHQFLKKVLHLAEYVTPSAGFRDTNDYNSNNSRN